MIAWLAEVAAKLAQSWLDLFHSETWMDHDDDDDWPSNGVPA